MEIAHILTLAEYRAKVDRLARAALALRWNGGDPEQRMHDHLTDMTFEHDDGEAVTEWHPMSTLDNSFFPLRCGHCADGRCYLCADHTLRNDVRLRMDDIDPDWRERWGYR